MGAPKNRATGKTTDLRERLSVYRSDASPEYGKEIAFVADIYATVQSINRLALRLRMGKRSLERCIRDFPELATAIRNVRVGQGRG